MGEAVFGPESLCYMALGSAQSGPMAWSHCPKTHEHWDALGAALSRTFETLANEMVNSVSCQTVRQNSVFASISCRQPDSVVGRAPGGGGHLGMPEECPEPLSKRTRQVFTSTHQRLGIRCHISPMGAISGYRLLAMPYAVLGPRACLPRLA